MKSALNEDQTRGRGKTILIFKHCLSKLVRPSASHVLGMLEMGPDSPGATLVGCLHLEITVLQFVADPHLRFPWSDYIANSKTLKVQHKSRAKRLPVMLSGKTHMILALGIRSLLVVTMEALALRRVLGMTAPSAAKRINIICTLLFRTIRCPR